MHVNFNTFSRFFFLTIWTPDKNSKHKLANVFLVWCGVSHFKNRFQDFKNLCEFHFGAPQNTSKDMNLEVYNKQLVLYFKPTIQFEVQDSQNGIYRKKNATSWNRLTWEEIQRRAMHCRSKLISDLNNLCSSPTQLKWRTFLGVMSENSKDRTACKLAYFWPYL